MGAQSSLLGLVGAAAVGANKIAESSSRLAKKEEATNEQDIKLVKKEESKAEQDIKLGKALENKADIQSEVNVLEQAIDRETNVLGQLNQGIIPENEEKKYGKMSGEDINKDIEMREKALKVLKSKLKAKKMQNKGYRALIKEIQGGKQ